MCLHMSLPMTTMGKYCPTLVAKKKGLFLLDVLPYVSSDYFPVHILQQTLYSLMAFRAIFYYVHFTLVTFVAQFTHKSIVPLCTQGDLIGVAELLVIG